MICKHKIVGDRHKVNDLLSFIFLVLYQETTKGNDS